MRKTVLALFLLIAVDAFGSESIGIREVTVTQSGVNGESLSADPETDPIAMVDVKGTTNQLSLRLEITPGTSAVVRVSCKQADTSTETPSPVPVCDATRPVANCGPDVRQFTLADYPTVGGKKIVTSSWAIVKAWAVCMASDPADGTGTVIVTGRRSWQ